MFGYGPGRLRRILRLGQAVSQARSGAVWATVAHRCGYADQAHLAREVRDLVGVTPSSLLGALSTTGSALPG